MPKATYGLFEYLCREKDLSMWTLVGGTALSIYLHHRTSEDLDFFIEDKELLKGSLNFIERFTSELEEEGYEVVAVDSDRYVREFEINGVKVTFFASSLKQLKENKQQIGSIDIASIDTIAAMKMQSIIKYRTISRDFFDVYTLWKSNEFDLYNLIDNYRNFYNKNLAGDIFEKRFFDRNPDATDPGFENLEVSNVKSIGEIRDEFFAWLDKQHAVEAEFIGEVLNGNDDQPNFTDLKFGLSRMLLPQKLATFGSDDKVLELLGEYQFDLTYESIDGKTLLDRYEDNAKMREQIAAYMGAIPDRWLNSKRYAFKPEILELLKYEKSVISQVEYVYDSSRLRNIARKKGYDEDGFIRDVAAKHALLKKYGLPAHSIDKAIDEVIDDIEN